MEGSLDWQWAAHESWRELERAGGVLLNPLEENASAAREAMMKLVEGARNRLVNAEGDKVSAAVVALLMQIGLQQLAVSGEEGDACSQMLEDLCHCYANLMGETARAGKRQDKSTAKDIDEPDPWAVLADVCVGVLSLRGAGGVVRGVRETVKKAWALICSSRTLNKASVEVILQAVCPSAEVDEDDMDESEEEASDDEDEKSATDDNDGEPAQLRKAMAEEEEGDDDEEDVMVSLDDDDALLQILGEAGEDDEGAASIQNIISLRKQSRKAGKMEVEKVRLQHRLRTLDLLEVFASKQPSNGLLLLSLRPALGTFRSLQAQSTIAEAQALSARLRQYITKILAGKARPKLSKGSEVTMEDVKEIATAIRGMLTKGSYAKAAPVLTAALTCSIRAALSTSVENQGATAPEWLLRLYQSALDDLMTKRSGPPPSIFDQFILRFPSPALHALLSSLIHFVTEATKSYRRAEACRMLASLLSQRRNLSETASHELYSLLPQLADAAGQVLSREQDDGGDKKAKRVKPAINLVGAIVATLNDSKVGDASLTATSASSITTILNGLRKTASTSQSDGIKKMCLSMVRSLEKMVETKKDKALKGKTVVSAVTEEYRSDGHSGLVKKMKNVQRGVDGNGNEEEVAPTRQGSKKRRR